MHPFDERLFALPRACETGRNDELALLYEKVKIQRKAISQGEIAYRERLEDIRVLRCEGRVGA